MCFANDGSYAEHDEEQCVPAMILAGMLRRKAAVRMLAAQEEDVKVKEMKDSDGDSDSGFTTESDDGEYSDEEKCVITAGGAVNR